MGLQPRTVTVLRPSGEQTIPVEEARPGDTIVIKPGERIASGRNRYGRFHRMLMKVCLAENLFPYTNTQERKYMPGQSTRKVLSASQQKKNWCRYNVIADHPDGARSPGQ